MPENKLPDVKVVEGTPTTINHDDLAQRLNAAIIRDLGPQAFEPYVQTDMGAEDFTHFVHPGPA